MIESLAIRFPKSVKIENSRLALLFYFAASAAIAFVIHSFVQSKAYLSSGQVKGQVFSRATNWRSNGVADLSNLPSENQESCLNPKRYEFCDVANCTKASSPRYFANFECIDFCTDGSEYPCLETHERWMKTDNGIFFPTYFDETMVHRTPEGKRLVVQQQRIVKGVEDLAIAFDHEYTVETAAGLKRGGSNPASDAEAGVMTILKDDGGNAVASWLPGQTVTITAGKLLVTAGVSLDDLNLRAGKNFKPDSEFPVGVLMRISGLHLSIEMSYFNQHRHEENWDGPVCYLKVRIAKHWTEMPKVDTLDQYGSTRFRNYHGVQVQFTSKGSFGWVDPAYLIQSLLNLFTQAVVMIAVVKKSVFILAMHGLGYLSAVYRRFIYQQVNIGHECEGVAARLVSFSEAFHSIQDIAHGVTEQRIFQRFRKIFKYRDELQPKEILRIAKVFFNSMAEEEGHPIHGPIINMQEFSQACCANEALTFELLAGIFDADRKRSILEKIFEDGSIIRLFAGDDDNVPTGWSAASLTKFPLQAEENSVESGGKKKKKKKRAAPLNLLFKEVDDVAHKFLHMDTESLGDSASNKILTHAVHQMKDQVRSTQEQIMRLQSEMDELLPDITQFRDFLQALQTNGSEAQSADSRNAPVLPLPLSPPEEGHEKYFRSPQNDSKVSPKLSRGASPNALASRYAHALPQMPKLEDIVQGRRDDDRSRVMDPRSTWLFPGSSL